MILHLRSSSSCITEVEQYVRQLFEQFGLDPELYPNILISLTEAVNNAVQHGNRNDVSKTVFVRSEKQQHILHCEISDEGRGFDPDKIPDPTDPENIEKPGGRGVFLMRQLSDNVRFRDNGSTVELEFLI
jgi:anti-sigma regulatory factor (Ser/Thr protein kinase)